MVVGVVRQGGHVDALDPICSSDLPASALPPESTIVSLDVSRCRQVPSISTLSIQTSWINMRNDRARSRNYFYDLGESS